MPIETGTFDSYTVIRTSFEVREGGDSLKIKLSVSQEHYQEIKAALTEHGIEIDENADLVISECSRYIDNLMVKGEKTGERIVLSTHEIISIESFGHSVEVYTQNEMYQVTDRLYRIESQLDPANFLRISNSVIIAKDKIRKINPTLSMKFVLTMSNGRKVDVTRSYYYIFKDFLGI